MPIFKSRTPQGQSAAFQQGHFDNRSFRLNDEANLNIYDEAFAKAQVATFEDDLRQSRAVTLAQWRERPLHEKAMEHLARLLSAQL